jgi:3-hydroxyisobutyrate dehydrogenase-like beta-hydroxyacid dehydrogenase
MRVGFLGLGKMGGAVARHLAKAGHELTVWNRTAARADELSPVGATVAVTPADAVKAAEIVFTMLMDDEAVEDVVLSDGGMLGAMESGAVHVSLSTISVALSKKLMKEHAAAAQGYVAAPVFGRPSLAAEGKLWIVAAGEQGAVDRVWPLLAAFSRGVSVVSDQPSSAHALKIGGNFLITAMIETVSEALVFAEANGLQPEVFLETVNSALFQSPFYANYGKVMLHPPETPGATIALGAKDMHLFRDAAREAGVRTPFADAFAADLQRARESGLVDKDWAAGLYELAKKSAANRGSQEQGR